MSSSKTNNKRPFLKPKSQYHTRKQLIRELYEEIARFKSLYSKSMEVIIKQGKELSQKDAQIDKLEKRLIRIHNQVNP